MRRVRLAPLIVLFVLIAGGAVVVATRISWLPTAASRQAGGIDFLYWFVSGIAIFVFSLVAAVVVFSVWKFRVPIDDDADGPPLHGHTGLEVVWTAVPALLVTAIAVLSAVVLARNERLPKRHLTVDVIAQQFTWRFRYPSLGQQTYPVLRLPLGKPVEFTITSLDVIHSFWVPEFRQKQDAVPGLTTHLVVTPTRLGRYTVICAELCGLGHATMRNEAIVMPTAAFARWLRRNVRR